MRLSAVVQRIRIDITHGENLDAYVAVILGCAFTVIGVFVRIQQEWLSNFVLLTLTSLIVVSLRNRYALQSAERALEKVQYLDASTALKDRTEYEPLDDRLSGASEVVVVGHHLLGFVGYNRDLIRRYARRGCVFKFILCDPAAAGSTASMATNVGLTIETLREISRDAPGKIIVRTVNLVLPCSAFCVDIGKPYGLIQIQPHSLFKEADMRPHFNLKSNHGSPWYHHYKEQVESLWSGSTPVSGF